MSCAASGKPAGRICPASALSRPWVITVQSACPPAPTCSSWRVARIRRSARFRPKADRPAVTSREHRDWLTGTRGGRRSHADCTGPLRPEPAPSGSGADPRAAPTIIRSGPSFSCAAKPSRLCAEPARRASRCQSRAGPAQPGRVPRCRPTSPDAAHRIRQAVSVPSIHDYLPNREPLTGRPCTKNTRPGP
jgi:hypothetical protein